MKVIDLLNKIANGEEMPKKIYCFNREFHWIENTYFGDTFTLMHYIQEEDLNDEVEIIEDSKINYKDAYESVLITNKMVEKENQRLQNIIKEVRELLDKENEKR